MKTRLRSARHGGWDDSKWLLTFLPYCPFAFPPLPPFFFDSLSSPLLCIIPFSIWAAFSDRHPVYRSILPVFPLSTTYLQPLFLHQTCAMTLFTSRLMFLLLALLSTAWAQNKNIIPTSPSSSFPACGLSCSTLVAAQDSCTANAPQSTWFSCFCQSSLLYPLQTSGSICSNCDASDQALVSTWYNNYCSSGGTDTGVSNGGSPVGAPAPSGTSAVPNSSASPASGKNQGW